MHFRLNTTIGCYFKAQIQNSSVEISCRTVLCKQGVRAENPVGPLTRSDLYGGGIAYDAKDGLLYTVSIDSPLYERSLISFNLKTRETRVVGVLNVNGAPIVGFRNLAFDDSNGKLFGLVDLAGPNWIVEIDPSTGNVTMPDRDIGHDSTDVFAYLSTRK